MIGPARIPARGAVPGEKPPVFPLPKCQTPPLTYVLSFLTFIMIQALHTVIFKCMFYILTLKNRFVVKKYTLHLYNPIPLVSFLLLMMFLFQSLLSF